MFFQNGGGIDTIIYYAPTLLKNVGFIDRQSIIANAAIGLLNMLMTLPAMKPIDKAGRRPLLIVGASGMCAGMLFLGLMTLFGLTSGQTGSAITVTLTGIAVSTASFAISSVLRAVMLVGAGAVGDAARTVPAADPGRRDGHLHDAELAVQPGRSTGPSPCCSRPCWPGSVLVPPSCSSP